MSANSNIILDVKNLKQHFPIHRGFFQRVVGHTKAVDGISFFLREQEVLGLVGESGCGKTTTGRSILRLYDPTGGEVWYTRADGQRIDIATITQDAMKPLRRELRMIFQDPFSSLNPRMTVRDIIGEPLIIHGIAKGRALEERVADLMKAVGLNPAYMRRYPHEFSGGQRQRIGLARTLSLNPRIIIADEPVSALDVSIQAQVLNLLQELKEQLGLTMLFIAHDLSVVEHICDRHRCDVCGQNRGVDRIGRTVAPPHAPLYRGVGLGGAVRGSGHSDAAHYSRRRCPQPGESA